MQTDNVLTFQKSRFDSTERHN
ncbi:hypothetical protein EMIT0P44_170031 [Pseudomonas sp. IT-P44]